MDDENSDCRNGGVNNIINSYYVRLPSFIILLLQQHWLSNEQARLRFQQVGPKSKQGTEPPEPPLTLTTVHHIFFAISR